MTARETRRADELTPETHVVLQDEHGLHVRIVNSAYTVKGRTTVVFDDGEPIRLGADKPFALATQEDVEAFDAAADRAAFVATLHAFANRVAKEGLPAPHQGDRIRIGFDVHRVEDVERWAGALSSRPQPGTSRLIVKAEAEGVEVEVRGPVRCAGCQREEHDGLCDPAVIQADAQAARIGTVAQEFGPMYADKEFGPDHLDDLVDAALTGSQPALQELARRPYGFAPPSGHKTAATEDAYRTDRYSGED